MIKHSTSHVTHEETIVSKASSTELSITLKARRNVAEAKYVPYDVRAKRFDDERESFSSTMDNFLEASRLTTEIVLLLAEKEEEMV